METINYDFNQFDDRFDIETKYEWIGQVLVLTRVFMTLKESTKKQYENT